ncbi:Vitamin B12 import system permease protein BtuC [Streptomyces tanashiensis]
MTRTAQIPLLCSALTGAVIVVVADLLGRRLFSPVELPVGVLTAAVGAPYLIWLIVRSRAVGAPARAPEQEQGRGDRRAPEDPRPGLGDRRAHRLAARGHRLAPAALDPAPQPDDPGRGAEAGDHEDGSLDLARGQPAGGVGEEPARGEGDQRAEDGAAHQEERGEQDEGVREAGAGRGRRLLLHGGRFLRGSRGPAEPEDPGEPADLPRCGLLGRGLLVLLGGGPREEVGALDAADEAEEPVLVGGVVGVRPPPVRRAVGGGGVLLGGGGARAAGA